MFKNSFLRQFTNATQYSIDGLKFLLKSEFAARIELYFFLWIFAFLIFFELPYKGVLNTLTLFLFLLAVEALNTSIEVIVDRVSPEISKMGKQAKDLGSFSVMCVLIINILHLIFAIPDLNFSKFEWGTTLFISVLFFALGLYLAIDRKPRKKWKLAVSLVAGIYLFVTGIYLVANYFTGVGFDSKVVYHLKAGVGGAGFGEYLGLMFWAAIYLVLSIAAIFFIADLIGRKKLKISKQLTWFRFRPITFGRGRNEKQKEKKAFGLMQNYIAGFVLFLSLLTNPFAQDLAVFVRNEAISSSKITDYEFYAQPDSLRLSRKRNVVFVYLESLERTYFDTEIFPDLVPNLSRLESQNISFTELRYTNYVGWTIAGMLATQCGVPLYSSSQGNAMSSYDSFMPNALCMGDILKKNGYELSFMNGGDTQFAGKDKFYKTHGFDTVIGKREHKADESNDGLYNLWGLHDDRLLDIAHDKFLEQSDSNTPFGLFVLTVGTHHPRGHMSNSCDGMQYQDGMNHMLNAVKCSDHLVNEFVKKITDSPYAKDTLIVLLSDHLAMKNEAYSLLNKGERRNFFTIIDPYNRTPSVINRPASSMDVGPTVLSFLGFGSEGLGFGRNLLGDEPTLMEAKGDKAVDFVISMKKTMQTELWKYPDLSKGVQFDTSNKTVKIGERSFKAPVLISLEENNMIEDIKFFLSKSKEQETHFEKNAFHSGRFLWIDSCELIMRYTVSKAKEEMDASAKNKTCAYSNVDDLKENTILENSSPLFTSIFPTPKEDSPQ